ncbi:MAG: NUDIX hydrolase [Chloroflexi bacterium]|nr:NUDIX hydrolase [Chloroflexota bacterium]
MKQKDKKLVWAGSSWQLYEEIIELDDGSTMARGQIDHPGAVVLVPLLSTGDDPQVVMIHQFRHALGESILELPAGTRGQTEDWLLCAQRELQEETGYRADTLQELSQLWPTPGLSNERMIIYLATGLHADPLPADADEQIEVKIYPLAALLTMIKDGRILDAKTIIGLWQTAVSLQIPIR